MSQRKNKIELLPSIPDITISSKKLFGTLTDIKVPAFSHASELVPEIDPSYQFHNDTTIAILSGFAFNRRVLIQGYHGTGKSTHIEQVAARLKWPLIRLNLDGHISRIDLIGRDAIVVRDGKQVTEFKEGILPYVMQRGIALVLDEYDAGRPDVMFIIQRLLEANGKLTLTDQNRVINPHPAFRIFATANTIGLGDSTGLYHGTQVINQGQLDRWNITALLNYLPEEQEIAIVIAKIPDLKKEQSKIRAMVKLAGLTRQGFMAGDISTVMSPRTVISWAENLQIFSDLEHAFMVSFLNRCDEADKPVIAEYYQRAIGKELPYGKSESGD